jgi:ribosomal-protein-serine acetyltransferase
MFTLYADDEVQLRLLDRYQFDAFYSVLHDNLDFFAKYLPWAQKPDYNEDDLQHFIDTGRREFGKETAYQCMILLHGKPVGAIGLHILSKHSKRAEIGYWLGQSAMGQGVMTRACLALCHFGFNTLGLNKIIIRAAPDNARSWAIAERLGFNFEGLLRQEAYFSDDTFIDLKRYAMLAQDWRKHPKNTGAKLEFEHCFHEDYCLRPVQTRYAEAMTDVINRNYEHLRTFLPWARHDLTPEEEVIFIESSQVRYSANNGGDYLIFKGDTIVGACGYHYWDFMGGDFEIGYWLAKDHTGKGIMTKAVQALCHYAFDVLGLQRALILCHPNNKASAAIPQRLGFRYDQRLTRTHPQTQDEQLLDQYILEKTERCF